MIAVSNLNTSFLMPNRMQIPDDSKVIFEGVNGEPKIIYGDMRWDLKFLATAHKSDCVIIYNKKTLSGTPSLVEEVKFVTYALIEHHLTHSTPSPTSYYCWHSSLNDLAHYAQKNKVTLTVCLTKPETFEDYYNTSKRRGKHITLSILKTLFSLGPEVLGWGALDPAWLNLDREEKKQKQNQTLVIPQRIYLGAICFLKDYVSNFDINSDAIEALIKLLNSNTNYGRMQQAKSSSTPNTHPDFNQALVLHGLYDFATRYCWRNVLDVANYLSSVQFACKTLIHIFSGMRDDEAYSLLTDCLRHETVDGEIGFWLHGKTTKMSGYRKPAAWVTSEDVQPAVNAAIKIANWIAKYEKPKGTCPLFPNVNHFKFCISNSRSSNFYGLANLTHHRFNNVFDLMDSEITKEDIKEIKFIEYTRNWGIETKYVVSKRWHFTTHQFRRSLAYYAIDSSLVSFPSLKSQLQHIRMRMTVHYTKGGNQSRKHIGEFKEHMCEEFSHVRLTVAALSYIKDVPLSDERLTGGHGNFVEIRIKPLGKAAILNSREETVRHVVQGIMSYKARATGGCMSNSPCHKHLINPLTACHGCRDGVVNPRLLLIAVNTYTNFMETLPSDSPEHKTCSLELEGAQKILNNYAA
jgi:hypothetical protein